VTAHDSQNNTAKPAAPPRELSAEEASFAVRAAEAADVDVEARMGHA
jgi:hypothetical protein